MRKSHWILASLAVCLLLTLQACAPKSQEDCGFVQNVYGRRISWKGRLPVVLRLHESVPQSHVGAIYAAVSTWNQAAGKTVFEIQNGITHLGAGRDNANVISYASSWEPDRMSEQAKTSIHWIGDQIQEADIRINDSERAPGVKAHHFYWLTGSGVNIEALVLHELGHVLGLKHKDAGQSVMNTYLANNNDRIQLASTDADSLVCEY